ncbi:Sphingosine-1-phosphate lyase Short=S1PL; Short=SP-lyase; Short=ySPL; AltName: Full=Bestowed of sphingosine tolerance 1; AltName: Full=Sphingosine-1-phosphate aldolase [Serendipita indica DSM 11827]|uniref:sphinganine-1-phosphate aldolase n=1 Tax=Serendipita indica (strain DSM 11827) TaxID=1109443 RepID=G4TBD6_SERID|nr:Sphingosine-1-phosphate lyase Short=S1PL; Short=SP-lyase; Short=ySPL; AltName: Full=Bestowed of sphingosine tolerance 1; AltName: Full=Sphingosine-1-phosphate aldolase [Serendipita indica DSM 11827]CCA68629.1 probable sphingosine-1-phosphate lyase [Serendipita indica DSM 11827]
MSLTLRSQQARAGLTALLQNTSTLSGVKSLFFYYFVLRYVLRVYRHVRGNGARQSVIDFWRYLSLHTMLLSIRYIPAIRKKVESEMAGVREDIRKKLIPEGPKVIRHLSLPAEGKSKDWIVAEMQRMDDESSASGAWKDGKISGAIYHGGEDVEKVIMAALERYCVSNPLHPDVFPAIRKMEAEVVAMCLRMYNHPNGCGVTTSGGTESIIMSCKAHRDWARAMKGITEPEIVMAASAHAAFNKAGHYFNIKIVTIPVDPRTRQININKVKRAINANTIMLVGSAVNFPDGAMDDIPALSQLAQKHKIGLHVDCCLGSFIVPFLEKAGYPTKRFDFRLPGVTAISCDTHKYGFAPKGSSVIMYRDNELRSYQYFVLPDWAGGVYASPAIAGSRPGALIAGTWAVMHYMGEDGYLASCKAIMGAAKRIERAVRTEIPELYVLGTPPASVVAFGSATADVNIHAVGDAMSARGWHLNALVNPPGLHIAVTRLTVNVTEQLIADLKDAVAQVKGKPTGKGNMVTLYGLGSSSPVGHTMVSRVASIFLDTMYVA